MKKTGKATGVLVQGGVDLRPRTTFAAVKRSVCHKCGGSWWDRDHPRPEVKAPVYLCGCIAGWTGTTTDLGVISDSGPRRFFPRLVWRAQQWIAGAWERFSALVDTY